MSPPTISFEQACQEAVDGLRAAFVELYDSVDADPLSPQDVARRFGLNKTLTWNVSRLVQAPDGLAAVAHVPGRAAIEKMLGATERGEDDLFRLPIRQRVAELPGSPPAVATSLVPRYAAMVRTVYERLDWTASRFRGVRLQMPYPPFGATVTLRFALPDLPGS